MAKLFYIEILPKDRFEADDAALFQDEMKSWFYETGAPFLWDYKGFGQQFDDWGHVQITTRLSSEIFLLAVWPHIVNLPSWMPFWVLRILNYFVAMDFSKKLHKRLVEAGYANAQLKFGDMR